MLEREARNKYLKELGSALALYTVVLFTCINIANGMGPGSARSLVMVVPMIPVLLAVWAIARQFRRMDEFVRTRSLESIAIAAAVTAGWTLTYGFLEQTGFPHLSMFWVWPVMGGVWATVDCLRRVFPR